MSDEALRELAIAAGLMPDWTDAEGHPRTVPPETLRAVLEPLGYPADSDARIEEGRERLSREAEKGDAPRIAYVGRPLGIGRARRADIVLEHGERQALDVFHGEDGHHYAHLPPVPGYHRIETADGAFDIALSPGRCTTIEDLAPGRKLAGLSVQLYSLRGSGAFGDLSALAALARKAAPLGIDALAVSPLHALLPSAKSFTPYSPSSRLFIDPIHVGLPGATTDSGEALVAWPPAIAAKRATLRRAYTNRKPEPPAFRAFAANADTGRVNHARFQVLSEHFADHGEWSWREWPAAYRDPQSAAVASFAREHADAIRRELFFQWLSETALQDAQAAARNAGMAVGIVADIAVGTDPNGSDAWSMPDALLSGITVGAPPDIFNRDGQNWGVTALSPAAMRRDGYAGFLAMLRAAMRNAGGVRIDHVLGFQRLWLVPQGAKPAEGVYLKLPLHELLALVALESTRHQAIVIGEDLGTVPDGFRDLLRDTGIYGMQILFFERDGRRFREPNRWSAHSVAMTTTHDLPTVAGWWQGRDIDWLEELGRRSEHGGPEEERQAREEDRRAFWDAMTAADCAEPPPPLSGEPARAVEAAARFIAKTPCELALLPLEDVYALPEQPNIPGTIDEHPNWRRRLPDDPIDAPGPKAVIDAFTESRRR